MPAAGQHTPVIIRVHLDRGSTWSMFEMINYMLFLPMNLQCSALVASSVATVIMKTTMLELFTVSVVLKAKGSHRHHRGDDPADIDGIRSVLQVHLWIPQGIIGVVQDFEADVHHIVLKLREWKTGRLTKGTIDICLPGWHTSPACLSSSPSSQEAVKRQAPVCVVWLHSDTSHTEASSVQQISFLT